MGSIYKPSLARQFGKGLLATGIACCLMLLLTVATFASTVHVYDQAGVLNASQVQSAAQSLPDPMDIYTTSNYNGNSSSFVQQTRTHITSSNLIVMAIDTTHHYLAIEGGSSVRLSNSQYNDAISSFKSNFNNGDYTGATVAAINSLRSALGSSSSSSSSSGLPASSGGFNFGFGTLCCVGLLILAAIALFGIFRRRGRGGFPGRPQPPMGGPYQQGYPPNYYGPGYNQGQGMNPWVAGGLGAAAGGLAGYELGKQAGENQQGQGGNFGNEGNFGGGAAGSFGNDNDFGGGGGGSFGGGGDFGGGGGGGDFGGGGGGAGGGGGSGSF